MCCALMCSSLRKTYLSFLNHAVNGQIDQLFRESAYSAECQLLNVQNWALLDELSIYIVTWHAFVTQG